MSVSHGLKYGAASAFDANSVVRKTIAVYSRKERQKRGLGGTDNENNSKKDDSKTKITL